MRVECKELPIGVALALCFSMPVCVANAENGRLRTEAGIVMRAFGEYSASGIGRRESVTAYLEHVRYEEFPGLGVVTELNVLGRLDSADSERSTIDVREAYVRKVVDKFEAVAGVGRVFWGTLESAHLVDIVNQSNLAENIDGEDKLGQPLIKWGYRTDYGILEFFYLPVFRERKFPGKGERLRLPAWLNDEDARVDSRRGHGTHDYAIRYSGANSAFDYGLSYFNGVNRAPRFEPAVDESGLSLRPRYERISQVSLDAVQDVNGWLFKLEALRQVSPSENHWSAGGGVEYSVEGILNSGWNLGILGEYLWDERRQSPYAPFQNDFFGGLRFSANDAASTEALLGVIVDLGSGDAVVSAEASRRLGDNTKLGLEIRAFAVTRRADPFYEVRRDSYLQVLWAHYF